METAIELGGLIRPSRIGIACIHTQSLSVFPLSIFLRFSFFSLYCANHSIRENRDSGIVSTLPTLRCYPVESLRDPHICPNPSSTIAGRFYLDLSNRFPFFHIRFPLFLACPSLLFSLLKEIDPLRYPINLEINNLQKGCLSN